MDLERSSSKDTHGHPRTISFRSLRWKKVFNNGILNVPKKKYDFSYLARIKGCSVETIWSSSIYQAKSCKGNIESGEMAINLERHSVVQDIKEARARTGSYQVGCRFRPKGIHLNDVEYWIYKSYTLNLEFVSTGDWLPLVISNPGGFEPQISIFADRCETEICPRSIIIASDFNISNDKFLQEQ